MTFKVTKNNSNRFAYKSHSYEIYKPKSDTINQCALLNSFSTCEYMLSKYSKVCMLRIDLHPANYNPDNKLISSYLKHLTIELEKKYNCQVRYFCAREQDSSIREHYHLALFLSGHKVNHSNTLQSIVNNTWKSFSNGSTKYVEHPYYIMKRGDKSSINNAIYRLSYITKNYSKHKNGKAKSYIFSRISKQERDELKNKINLLVDPEITRHKKLKKLINLSEFPCREPANKPPAAIFKMFDNAQFNCVQKIQRTLRITEINDQIQQHLKTLISLFELAESILPKDYAP